MPLQSILDVENRLRATPTVRDLDAIWQARVSIAGAHGKKTASSEAPAIAWLEDPALPRQFVAHALRLEDFRLVIDAAREILRTWDTSGEEARASLLPIRLAYAVALTRLGQTREARLQLDPCVRPGFRPVLGRRQHVDFLLQLGYATCEESHQASSRPAQLKLLEEALYFYQRALEVEPNRLEAQVLTAATELRLAGSDEALRAKAQASAQEVLKLTQVLHDEEGPRFLTGWVQATAHAILGAMDEAYRDFEQLQQTGCSTGDLAEARYQAQSLAEAQGKPSDFFKAAFPPLQLIVFAGHNPDLPGWRVRLPSESIPAAREAIRAQLKAMGARVGLASASAGADLLFTDVMRELGGGVHLVLPWAREEFRRSSVTNYDPPGERGQWGPLFDQALESAASTREIGQLYEPSSDAGWEFMMEVTAGLAIQTARERRLDVQPVVLWDGREGRGVGGTDSFFQFWNSQVGITPVIIPTPAVESPTSSHIVLHASRRCERPILHQEVKTMLFADIVGYSKLTEKSIPDFIEPFLARMGRLASAGGHVPCHVNTWGDALYAVFDFACDAGIFALELARMLAEGKPDWLARGLYQETLDADGHIVKEPLNIRIGLHTGPVVIHYDPVVRRLGFTGTHVSRAARIEPITEPGQVFASEEFAAMIEVDSEIQRRTGAGHCALASTGFTCEFVQRMHLAKNYPGLHNIYRVVPKPVFSLEPLAEAVHEDYCLKSAASAPASSLRPWRELDEDQREANRAQAADIPNKLRLLGYELVRGGGLSPSQIIITADQMEELAMREHERWMAERRRRGWTYAPERDNARKLHPMLVPWDDLPEHEKDKDRDTLRNLPALVAKSGFTVRKTT